ncbi:MAG: cell wall hydrolase [Alphaproteobacteria bacterium]|nr:cell wall hydrolase [Alphaproteobacteria bacterium]
MSDVEILAKTIYGEARGEGLKGMEAVACVVMNRVKAQQWFTGYVAIGGHKVPSISATCLKRLQFSCWNKNDPNYAKLQKVNTEDHLYNQCLSVACRAIGGELKDITNGAVYYHTKQIKPLWAKEKNPCFIYKNHIFYQ